MKAVVLESKNIIQIREMEFEEKLGPRDVRIAVHCVGICGSDVHYYEFGRIGPYVVDAPMVLGHEASGAVIEVGAEVSHLKTGDRVCMEPGIPDRYGKATSLGMYNLDPKVIFWATPPVHGCLRESVVHPGDFTYRLPQNVSLEEGALVEPLAVALYAATKAKIKPGDNALVIGAGTIGMMTALCAAASGCGKVFLSDINTKRLEYILNLSDKVSPTSASGGLLETYIKKETEGWGVDVVFECSGSSRAYGNIFSLLCPGGRLVIVGIPVEPVSYDVPAAQAKEVTVEHTFRYAHVFPKAVSLLSSKSINVEKMITDVFPFEKAVEAFQFALHPSPRSIKVLIHVNPLH